MSENTEPDYTNSNPTPLSRESRVPDLSEEDRKTSGGVFGSGGKAEDRLFNLTTEPASGPSREPSDN